MTGSRRAESIPAQRTYDLVVVGARLGGLLTAAVAAARGASVLVVPIPRIASLDFYVRARAGYLFERGLHLLPTPATRPLLRRAVDEAEVFPHTRGTFVAEEPVYQVVLPKHRVDVFADAEAYGEDVEREFPGYGAAVLEETDYVRRLTVFGDALFPDALVPRPRRLVEIPAYVHRHLNARRTLRAVRHLAGTRWTVTGTEVDRLASAPLVHTAMVAPRTVTPLIDAHTAAWRLRGGTALRGGVAALYRHLCAAVTRQGGTVSDPSEVIGIVLRYGTAVGVRLAARGPMTGARVVLAALPAAALHGLIPPKMHHRRYHRAVAGISASELFFCVHVGVRAEVLPVGMARTVFVPSCDGAPPLTIRVADPDDPTRAPEGRAALTLIRRVPWTERDLRPEYLEQAAREMIAQATEVIPFLEDFVELVEVDMPGPTPLGEPLAYAAERPLAYGLVGLPMATPYRRLLFVGREVVPGMGLEGELLTGAVAADVIHGWFGRG